MSLKQSERNEALYKDYQKFEKGELKMWELIAKYHISVTRIKYLVNQMKLQDAAPNLDHENE